MSARFSRRKILQAAGAAALSSSARSASAADIAGPRAEGKDTPKICLGLGDGGATSGALDPAAAKRIAQLGVSYVLTGGGRIPWEENQLRGMLDGLKANGLSLGNLMISGFPNTLYGKPGRDEEIEKVIQSIRAAGKAGLPVVEYNFYAHRIVEGYYEAPGRAGAGNTAFDYDRVKDLPPLPQEGVHSLEEMWANITYFLKAVIPEAAKAGVRMALHPNDPPSPLSRGSSQIMSTIQGWKRLIDIVKS